MIWDQGGTHLEGQIFIVPLTGLPCRLLHTLLWVFRNFQSSHAAVLTALIQEPPAPTFSFSALLREEYYGANIRTSNLQTTSQILRGHTASGERLQVFLPHMATSRKDNGNVQFRRWLTFSCLLTSLCLTSSYSSFI